MLNPRAVFLDDVDFMGEILLSCVEKRNDIVKDQDDRLEFFKKAYPERDEVQIVKDMMRSFNPISNRFEKYDPLIKINNEIRTLTIEIAKKEKIINTEAWESKFKHATEDARIEEISIHYLKKSEFRRRIRCPFHHSKEGGGKHLQIYPQTNSYHCFSCKASGKPVDFVMKIENCDFKEAVDILSNF